MNNKLAYPVNYVGIAQGYIKGHHALDLARYNTTADIPVLSCYDGVVIKIWEDVQFGGGLSMKIKYDNGYTSDFKHLDSYCKKVGDRVSKLEMVGIMGNTGWASKGVHVHFNLYNSNGMRVNPLEHCYLHPNQEVRPKDKNKVLVLDGEVISETITENTPKNSISVGDRVILNSNATFYQHASKGVKIPNSIKNKEYTVQQVDNECVLLKEIKSWVLINECTLVSNENIYTVVRGDTLSKIARKYDTTWQKIYDDNKDVIGENPNLIRVGQKLKIN